MTLTKFLLLFSNITVCWFHFHAVNIAKRPLISFNITRIIQQTKRNKKAIRNKYKFVPRSQPPVELSRVENYANEEWRFSSVDFHRQSGTSIDLSNDRDLRANPVYQSAFNFSKKAETDARIDGAWNGRRHHLPWETKREKEREFPRSHCERENYKANKRSTNAEHWRIDDDPRRPRGGRKPHVLEGQVFRATRSWMEDTKPEEREEEDFPPTIEAGILRVFEDEDSRMHAHAPAPPSPFCFRSRDTCIDGF